MKEKKLSRQAILRLMAEMGRKGGLKGGKARVAALTAEERRDIARRAAQKRWSKRALKDSGFDEQKKAFQSIPARTLARYAGRFIVARNGRIVDSDEDLSRLTSRFFSNHGSLAVYVTRVGAPLRISSPIAKT